MSRSIDLIDELCCYDQLLSLDSPRNQKLEKKKTEQTPITQMGRSPSIKTSKSQLKDYRSPIDMVQPILDPDKNHSNYQSLYTGISQFGSNSKAALHINTEKKRKEIV